MSTKQLLSNRKRMASERKKGIEDVNDDVNDLAVQYIIPVSVIVGVLLAAITIGCVCYRRWRFILKIKQQKAEGGTVQSSTVTSSDDEEMQKQVQTSERQGKARDLALRSA